MAKVSIITAVGREEPYIAEAAASVRALFDRAKEVHKDFYGEWIVSCDNVNVDPITKIAAPFRPDHHVHILGSTRKRALGPAKTRNRALRVAQGDIVGTLDSDDWYDIDGMSEMLDMMITQPSLAWIAGRVTDITTNGKSTYVDNEIGQSGAAPSGWVYDWVSTQGYFPFSAAATLVRREILDELGGWDVSKRFIRAEDLALWTRITNKYNGYWFDKAVYNYRKHEGMLHQNPLWRSGDESLKDLILNYLHEENENSEDFTEDLNNNN